MKKFGIINSEISAVIAKMGHTDTVAIVDAGFPVPQNAKLIDVSIEVGKPSLLEVLEVVLKELAIEKFVLASEIKEKNQNLHLEIDKILCDTSNEFISHEDFKQRSKNCRAIIRTGECSPYANIILQSGVIF